MRAEDFLNSLRTMPAISPEALTDRQPFLVLSPHADDETLGAGGLIAAACAAGQRVDVLILTDGSGSHPRSRQWPPARLAALRQEEAARAMAELGLPAGRLRHLGLPDTGAPTQGPAFDAAVEHIVSAARRADARSLFVTWGCDPHCDHEAAYAMARAARGRIPGIKLWAYPIWGWHLDPDAIVKEETPKGFRIEIADWRVKKRAALDAYMSQMTDFIADDPDGFRFDARTIAPFIGAHEYVFEVAA